MTTPHELSKLFNINNQGMDDFFHSPWPANKMFDVDVKETRTEISIKADLPGFKKDEIQVVLDDFSVTIKAYRNEEREEKGEKYYRQERQYGQIERTIPLPDTVVSESSKAKYEDGVLTITLKKTNPILTKPKLISIE